MQSMSRKLAFLGAISAMAVVGLAGPSMAAAKTYTVKMKTTKTCPTVGTHICSTFGGQPFGTCKMTGQLVIPESHQVWKCKGGSFHIDEVGTSGASNDAKGTWKASKGTGKFKGIKGKGTFHGKLSTGVFYYDGRVRY
jgi:hypothetical protein